MSFLDAHVHAEEEFMKTENRFMTVFANNFFGQKGHPKFRLSSSL